MVAGSGSSHCSLLHAGDKRLRFSSSPTLAAIGVDNDWADRALPNGTTYADLAVELQSLLAFDPCFSQPPVKGTRVCKLFDSTDIVNVVDNRLKHFLQAIEADPPHHGWGQYLLPEACK